jgi:hypothetical protein
LIDGDCVIVYHERSPLETGRLGLFADDGSILIDNVEICTHPRYLYDFNLARWCAEDLSAWRVASGNWGVISSLAYGLFGEKDSDRDAVIWHKEPLENDFAVQIEYMPHHMNDRGEFMVLLCADGIRPESGYQLRIAYEAEDGGNEAGTQNVRARLLRRGIEAARGEAAVIRKGSGAQVRIEKRSNTLRLTIDGEHLLAFGEGEAPDGAMFALGVSGSPSSTTIFNTIAVFDLLR